MTEKEREVLASYDKHKPPLYHPQDLWAEEWPTKPGLWWFYGWCWKPILIGKEKLKPPELHLVQMSCTANEAMIYITNGHFLYWGEGARGLWRKAELPDLPPLQRYPTEESEK